MKANQTKQDLLREVQGLTTRLQEAEEIIQAIRRGEVDGLLVATPEGDRVFTLEGAELPYRIFVESMHDGAATLTHEGAILYANTAFAGMLRLPQEKIIHKYMNQFIQPSDREIFASILKKAVQGTREGEGELLLLRNIPVQISLRLLPLYGESPIVCAVITDLTRQKKLKRTLESLNRSRAILNQAADAIIICDERGIITQASRETRRFGDTVLLGLYLDDAFKITFPSGLPLHKQVFTVVDVLKGRIFHKQEAIFSAGEKTFYFLLSAQPLRGKDKVIVGCVVTLTDITSLKQAEEEMRRQRLEIEQLYREAPVGLCLLDKDLRFIRINQRLAEINGIPAAEHIGKTVRELLPELTDAIEHPMRRTLETGEPQFNIEIISSTPAHPGIKRSFLEQWLPVIDGRGSVTGLNIVVEEITERKRMEQMLRESEEKFRSAFANAAIGFAMATPEGRFADANPAFCRITGYSIEELLTMEFRQLVHPEDYALNMKLTDQMMSGQSDYFVVENRYIRKDKTDVWVRKSLSLVRDAMGAILWRIALVEDITERKRVAEDLSRSMNILQTVLDNTPDPIFLKDRDGRILLCNPATLDLLGKPAEAVIGKTDAELYDDAATAQAIMENDQRIIQSDRVEVVEECLKLARGTRIYLSTKGPYRDSDGHIVGLIGTGRDITDRKQMEDDLRKRTVELEQLSQTLEERVLERTEELRMINRELHQSQIRLKQLSRDLLDAQEKERKRVAWELHDSIGSSLTAIKFRIENVLRESVSNGSQAIDRLKKLVPVVQTAVMEAKRIQMNLRPSILDDIGIVATTRWFCNQFRETYPEVQLERHVKINEDDVPDSLKTVIFRIVQEGLNNAARHSKSPLVSFYLWKSNQTLRLLIRDRGEGFDLSAAQSRTGYVRGFGLESMRERAELSGGRFFIRTKQRKGTVIRASWPTDMSSGVPS